MDRYLELNRILSLAGHVVYSIATRSSSSDYTPGSPDPLTPFEKETLDLVHLRKIQESDGVVLITDDEGYVGESTKREIKWAQMLGKNIYLTKESLEMLTRETVDLDPAKSIRRVLRDEKRREEHAKLHANEEED